MELSRTPPRRDDWEKWLVSMTYLEFMGDVMNIREPDLSLKPEGPELCGRRCVDARFTCKDTPLQMGDDTANHRDGEDDELRCF
jgi:hypothetical protein